LDLFSDFAIADYDAYKSLIFAQVTLSAEEFRLYRKMFDIVHKSLPQPDRYIFLYQKTDRLLENI
jgi:deoxyadenosine/deoxycytidine kinase